MGDRYAPPRAAVRRSRTGAHQRRQRGRPLAVPSGADPPERRLGDNHSASPCARYRKVFDADAVEFVAVRDVEPGCEITVDYTDGAKNELWFQPGRQRR
ncbi:MAG: SET domain-containing protein [Pseudonocardia sp.]